MGNDNVYQYVDVDPARSVYAVEALAGEWAILAMNPVSGALLAWNLTEEQARAFIAAAKSEALFAERVVAAVDEAVGDLSRELAEAKAGISRLRCELIEARNPGIEDDPQWKAERARRLEETA
jgi:hypothetical protein